MHIDSRVMRITAGVGVAATTSDTLMVRLGELGDAMVTVPR